LEPHLAGANTGDNLRPRWLKFSIIGSARVPWRTASLGLQADYEAVVVSRRKPLTDQRSFIMHPSFGIEYQCPSLKWEDVMKGPSREAVLAHTFKILHYRELFGANGVTMPGSAHDSPEPALDPVIDHYAVAA
jgi:hypothetical protein